MEETKIPGTNKRKLLSEFSKLTENIKYYQNILGNIEEIKEVTGFEDNCNRNSEFWENNRK